MPRKPFTPAQKLAMSRAQKARWKRHKLALRTSSDGSAQNGHLVEQRIVLHIQGSTMDLPISDAQALRDALDLIVPKTE